MTRPQWGGYATAKPTMYRTVEMRSELEAGFARWLDSVGAEWTYEPCRYAGRWTPDFEVPGVTCGWRDDPARCLVEIKPERWLIDFGHDGYMDLLSRMQAAREAVPGSELLVCFRREGSVGLPASLVRRLLPDNGTGRLLTSPAFWRTAPTPLGVAEGQPVRGSGALMPPLGPWVGRWWEAPRRVFDYSLAPDTRPRRKVPDA